MPTPRPSAHARIRRIAVLGAAFGCALLPLRARAQLAEGHLALPPGHWSLDAVRRAEALGLVDGYLPAQRTAARAEVARALREAAERARTGRPALATLADGWLMRFAEEFPEAAGRPGEWLGSSMALVGRDDEGRVAPGAGYSAASGHPPSGAAPLDDRADLGVVSTLAVRPSDGLAAQVVVRADRDRRRVTRWEVATASAGAALSVGRGSTGYGFSGSGVTLAGVAALERVQLQTVRPIILPLGLGRAAVHGQVGVLRGDRHPGEPVFVSTALTLRPHARITLAGYRAAILGGDSAGSPLTTRTFVQTLLGLTQNTENGFANQVASIDLRYRLPTEGLLAATLYSEWGMEDLDVVRSLRDSPGGLVGLYVPRLPLLPALSGGLERASFGRSCCGNGIWYRHFNHVGGWAAGDVPLGHPLGGHGRETAAYASTELGAARLRVGARGYRRFRGAENLYAPERGGRSRGGSVDAALRVGLRADLWLNAAAEEGDGWRTRGVAAGATLFF